jgi:hypothetical protein
MKQIITGHTPGPWRACYSETNEFGGGNIRSDRHLHGTGALLFTTGPMFHDYEVNREEELANLHLAASAPELLQALEELLGMAGDDHYGCDIDSDSSFDCDVPDSREGIVSGRKIFGHEAIRRAIAAIANAKGEANDG